MLVPLTAIVTTSLPLAAAMALCSKDRKTVHAKNKSEKSGKSAKGGAKSGKSGKSSKSGKGKSSKSGRSASRKSRRSSSKKSSKSGKKAEKKVGDSEKSETSVSEVSTATATSDVSKASKSSKGSKRSKRSDRLDSDAQKKMEKSGKCGVKAETKSLAEDVATIKHSSQMAVAPSRLQYQTLGGVSQIELKNTSGERKAYKVKCSDNALYRVNPVFGFAEPKSTVKIDVLRLNGEEKTDKLVLLTANAKDSSDPRDAFNNCAEQREMMVVPLVAA